MKRSLYALALVVFASSLRAPAGAAAPAAEDPLAAVISRQGYTVSLDLRVRKRGHTRQLILQLFDGEAPPNAFATGFVVGDGLVMTAYHVVSGGLSADKRRQLGFSANDQLEVEASVKGCVAKVLRIDPEADLALLGVCGSTRSSSTSTFSAPTISRRRASTSGSDAAVRARTPLSAK